MTQEIFELTLHGGAPESRYRRLRPEIARLPWGTLGARLPKAQVMHARRAWTDAALQEYASADAHASMLRLLIRARVPLDLSAMASRFPLDELAHAEICARFAGELGGGTPVAYEPDVIFPVKPLKDAPILLQAAEAVVWNCCVSETFAEATLRAAWKAAKHPLHRAARAVIAKDEALHARFGWVFMEWYRPALGGEERRVLARAAGRVLKKLGAMVAMAERAPDEAFSEIAPIGNVKRAEYLRTARGALTDGIEGGLARFQIVPE